MEGLAAARLSPVVLRDAWLEVASGKARDTFVCWSTETKEQDIAFTRRRVAHLEKARSPRL